MGFKKIKDKKGVNMTVHPEFYDKIEKERRKFMEKHRLNRLTTKAFTKVLNKRFWERKRRNKRGDASNFVTFIIVLFFLAVSFLIAAFVNDNISDVIKETDLNTTTYASSYTGAIDQMTTTTIQRGFAMIIAFLVIGMMISAFLIRIHPIFIFIYIITLGISLFAMIPIANTYEILIGTDALSSVADQQTMINWIMQYSVFILLGAGALSIIIIFAKLAGGTQSSRL
ncbi:hypothetical protein GF386_04080 [Candidatus Pacearchaeota archaeon]|nr:hypothetical protein [Candidatus Pacearchaeota archaeon]